MTPTNVGSTRPTDAELVKLLRNIYRNALGSPEKLCELVMVLGPTADALEAASVEPPPLAHITTVGQLFEVIDWDFDGNGLTVTLRGRDTRDLRLLANTIANTFPTLQNDMPHLVTTNDGQLGDGTDGQDRESYSDTQDRKSYTPTEV